MDAAAELGRNPVSNGFSLSMDMSRVTRDGTLPNPSRETKLSGANADREIIIFIFPVQLTTSRIGSHTRLIHTLAMCVTIHIHEVTYYTTRATRLYKYEYSTAVHMCVCVVSSHLFRTSGLRTYQPGSHGISPPSSCGAGLNFSAWYIDSGEKNIRGIRKVTEREALLKEKYERI